jgi:hypothetical protein
MRKESTKYVPVEVKPVSCGEEIAKEHLIAFANSFIAKEHIARWIHITLEKPAKAYREMVKFNQYLNQSKCQLIKGPDVFPLSLAKKYGPGLGVYFDGTGPAVHMSAAEAGMPERDAIFSIEPGRLAIFFFHEGWAWHCESK